MQTVTLGKTGLNVSKNGFGALPIQRINEKEAVYLLEKAYANGINYYDTARWYTDSEEKLGAAFSGIRDKIIISTKTGAQTAGELWRDLEQSLNYLHTDYIDIYQFHNPAFCPKPGNESGLYDAMQKAKEQGKIRFIGITNHRLAIAEEAVESGLYQTLQFPFSYLASEADLKIVNLCKEKDMGFIAMKALSGGLITNASMAYAYLAQFDHVAPIWGIQREEELEEFISFQKNPPILTKYMKDQMEQDRKELSGNFCRGCGYCLPCPVDIEINNCARMSLLLRRAPLNTYLSEEWKVKMKKVEACLHCNKCMSKCPYSLNTPELLKRNYEDYLTFI
ncbi:MAG: NADP-dependent oxidoreductase domain containing protein [Anaerocolumna sp.]|nr:NADP-dependent oxidoreductase domain containing protein [Anaerocolumna sp.]